MKYLRNDQSSKYLILPKKYQSLNLLPTKLCFQSTLSNFPNNLLVFFLRLFLKCVNPNFMLIQIYFHLPKKYQSLNRLPMKLLSKNIYNLSKKSACIRPLTV